MKSRDSRRCSKTVVDLSSIGNGTLAEENDHVQTEFLPLKYVDQSRGPDKNDVVPDAARYQVPFGLQISDKSNFVTSKDMKKQLECLRQELRDERKKELQELNNKRRQELKELREERRQDKQQLLDEIHGICREVKDQIHTTLKYLAEENRDNPSKGVKKEN